MFKPDLVYSQAVLQHIHPDEMSGAFSAVTLVNESFPATSRKQLHPPHSHVIVPMHTAEQTKLFSTPVDPAFGFKRIVVELTIPSVPKAARSACFAEHVYDKENRSQTSTVIALLKGAALYSINNGQNWDLIPLKETRNLELRNCFTSSNGDHILQAEARDLIEPSSNPDHGKPIIFRYSKDWQFVSESRPGESHWHGSRSVDEACGAIMFAEYPDNKKKYVIDPSDRAAARDPALHVPTVYRSLDGGTTWGIVMRKDWREIRHFHTILADPFDRGTWWLSSGDKAAECCVWVSRDNGDTWSDVTNRNVEVELNFRCKNTGQSVHRFTDLYIGEKEIIWGSDDWLGGPKEFSQPTVPVSQRAGSRLFRSPKSSPLNPQAIGFVGNPIRSMIDLGPIFLITTEAKHLVSPRPQVCILSKSQPAIVAEIFSVDVVRTGGTGFTYSRSSRAARDGVFFSYRGSGDLFQSPLRLLKWRVHFE